MWLSSLHTRSTPLNDVYEYPSWCSENMEENRQIPELFQDGQSHCLDSNCDDETELHWWTCNHCWEIRIGNIVLNFLSRLHRWRDRLQIRCTVQRHGKWQSSLQSDQTSSTALTISAGIMDHEEARRKHIGWKILGFFFYRYKARLYIVSMGRKKYVTELEAYLVTPALGELSLRTWFMLNPWVQEQIQLHSLF